MATDEHPVEGTADPARRDGARDAGTSVNVNAAADAEVLAERDRLREALKETNRKAKADRLRLEEIDRADADRRQKELPELERLKADLQVREREAREKDERLAEREKTVLALRIADAVKDEAIKAHFRYPSTVAKLIDLDRIEVDAETGEIKGVAKAVERLREEMPDLVSAPAGGGTPSGMASRRPPAPTPGAAPTDANGRPLSREEIARAEQRKHITYGF